MSFCHIGWDSLPPTPHAHVHIVSSLMFLSLAPSTTQHRGRLLMKWPALRTNTPTCLTHMSQTLSSLAEFLSLCPTTGTCSVLHILRTKYNSTQSHLEHDVPAHPRTGSVAPVAEARLLRSFSFWASQTLDKSCRSRPGFSRSPPAVACSETQSNSYGRGRIWS